MSEKIREAAKAGFKLSGDDATTDNLDSFRLAQDDFKKITAAVPASSMLSFAFDQISIGDFNKADLDGNHRLSVDELSAVGDKPGSPMKKAAFDALKRNVVDRTRDSQGVIGSSDVASWHELDPGFRGFDSTMLNHATEGNGQLAINASLETIKRADMAIPEGVSELIPKIQLKQEALKFGRDIELGADGKSALSKTPLSPERRVQIGKEITATLAGLNDQVQSRRDLSAKLYRSGEKNGRAANWADSALQKSDEMSQKVGTAGGATSIVDLASRQLNLGLNDQVRDTESEGRYDKVRDLTQQPIEVRRDLAAMSIGWNGSDNLTIDTSSPNFLPDKAERLANEAKQLWKEINRLDPADLKSAHQVSILGGSWGDLDPKGKLNFYQDNNRDGKIDLFQNLRKMKLQNVR